MLLFITYQVVLLQDGSKPKIQADMHEVLVRPVPKVRYTQTLQPMRVLLGVVEQCGCIEAS